MTMAETSFIKPFDDETADKLRHADKLCQSLAEQFRDYRIQCQQEGKQLELEDDDYQLIAIIGAYGILFNNAVDTGLIKDVLTNAAPTIITN